MTTVALMTVREDNMRFLPTVGMTAAPIKKRGKRESSCGFAATALSFSSPLRPPVAAVIPNIVRNLIPNQPLSAPHPLIINF